MSAPQWYYSRGDQQLGPVPVAELKKLVNQGRLSANELVWREGMADWEPAGRVKELAPVFATAPPPRTPAGESPMAGPAIRTRREWPALPSIREPRRLARFLLATGIVLAITARGCDGLGNRNVARLNAKYASATQRFEDEWEAKALVIQGEIRRLRDVKKELLAPSDDGASLSAEQLQANREESQRIDEEINTNSEALTELDKEKAKAERTLTDGKWRNMRIASREAGRSNAMWAYWREMFFVFGTILLTLGLLLTSYHGEGAERWVSLMMLAIITFSIYVGGIAWASSMRTLIPD